ncbi:MAG: hypothetical protein QGG97_04550 [Flavobacteriales bacterium]|nr:hypothetical protein [Flavobacteriales bacterium]
MSSVVRAVVSVFKPSPKPKLPNPIVPEFLTVKESEPETKAAVKVAAALKKTGAAGVKGEGRESFKQLV